MLINENTAEVKDLIENETKSFVACRNSIENEETPVKEVIIMNKNGLPAPTSTLNTNEIAFEHELDATLRETGSVEQLNTLTIGKIQLGLIGAKNIYENKPRHNVKAVLDTLFDACCEKLFYPAYEDENYYGGIDVHVDYTGDEELLLKYVAYNIDAAANNHRRLTLGEFVPFMSTPDYEYWFENSENRFYFADKYSWFSFLKENNEELKFDYDLAVDYVMSLCYLRYFTSTNFRKEKFRKVVAFLGLHIARLEHTLTITYEKIMDLEKTFNGII